MEKINVTINMNGVKHRVEAVKTQVKEWDTVHDILIARAFNDHDVFMLYSDGTCYIVSKEYVDSITIKQDGTVDNIHSDSPHMANVERAYNEHINTNELVKKI